MMETSSNLGKSLLPLPSPPLPLFHNLTDPLLAFSIAILCFLIYHVMYFWSVDVFASNMSHMITYTSARFYSDFQKTK